MCNPHPTDIAFKVLMIKIPILESPFYPFLNSIISSENDMDAMFSNTQSLLRNEDFALTATQWCCTREAGALVAG